MSGTPPTDGRTRLLAAVDEVVRERGATALTLREVARRAGVSHALPGVLFGDMAGMLTAYATDAFRELGVAMASAVHGADRPEHALAASGRAYIAFALAHPGRFELMFRHDALKTDDPAYTEACREAFRPLSEAVGLATGDLPEEARGDRRLGRTAAWCLVHGYAALWTGGHLRARADGADAEQLAADMTAWFAARALGA